MTTAPPPAPPPATTRTSKANAPPVPQVGNFQKASKTKKGSGLILYAPEGWGKTSFGAFAPDPTFIEAKSENGLCKLAEVGRIPDVNMLKCNSWAQLLAELDAMIASGPPSKFLVFDALGGFEQLCHEVICDREFRGNWLNFWRYDNGPKAAVSDWMNFLVRIQSLQMQHGTRILLLGHMQIGNHKNPLGDDFDRYNCDIHKKTTWGVTHKWADAVFFGNFVTIVDKDSSGKTKGIGGHDRVIYTERTDAYDAKNRFGLPEIIDIPDDPSKSFDALTAAMKGARKS